MPDGAAMPEAVSIEVLPVEAGWSARCSASGESLVYFSGAKAEESARMLAAKLSGSSRVCEVIVRDRHGGVVGTSRYEHGQRIPV